MDSRPKVEDEASSSTGKGSTSSSNSLLFLKKCSSIPGYPGLRCCSNMEPFSNEDIAIEILSRLPTCSLLAFKCTATKWNKLISDRSFLHIHHKSSYDIVGLFVQGAFTYRESRPFGPLCFYSLTQNKCRLNLDFLPEKFLLVGSSNGIICCRTYRFPKGIVHLPNDDEFITKDPVEFVIYLCDPTREEWITIRPPQGLSINDIVVLGLASYPFGTSSNNAPSFKLVNIQRSRKNVRSFFIYSSDTGKWAVSSAVCSFGSEIRGEMATFVNGWLHWSTLDYHLLAFDVENELSKLIKLPCCEPGVNLRVCFGESEGYLHYVCVLIQELQVWILKDYDQPVWELKCCLNLLEFCLMNASLLETCTLDLLVRNYYSWPAEDANFYIFAWSYYNEVLVLVVHDVVLSYNLKSGRVIKHSSSVKDPVKVHVFRRVVVQCHANLVSLGNYVGDGVESCLKQARRGGILPCKRPCES